MSFKGNLLKEKKKEQSTNSNDDLIQVQLHQFSRTDAIKSGVLCVCVWYIKACFFFFFSPIQQNNCYLTFNCSCANGAAAAFGKVAHRI